MTYTDTQLKQALAKMLPERIAYEVSEEEFVDGLYWNKGEDDGPKVLDTELLRLCWLVEETLNRESARSYTLDLHPKYINHLSADWCILHSTWQQRVVALAKVKGVEII